MIRCFEDFRKKKEEKKGARLRWFEHVKGGSMRQMIGWSNPARGEQLLLNYGHCRPHLESHNSKITAKWWQCWLYTTLYGLFNKTFVRSWVNLIFETTKPNVNKGSYVNHIKMRHAICSILGNKVDDDTAIKFGRKTTEYISGSVTVKSALSWLKMWNLYHYIL